MWRGVSRRHVTETTGKWLRHILEQRDVSADDARRVKSHENKGKSAHNIFPSAVGVKSKPESVVDGRQTLATILLWVIIISRQEKTPQLPARRQTRRVDVRLER